MIANLSIFIADENVTIKKQIIESFITSNFTLVGSAKNSEEAWKKLSMQKADLIIIDIHLKGKNDSKWLAKRVREFYNIPIIFTSSVGGYKVIKQMSTLRPDGFLMKPFDATSLITTINIAIDKYIQTTNPLKPKEEDFIFIQDGKKKVKVRFEDIHYLQSDGNYVKVVIINRTILIRGKISDFKNRLPQEIFLQTHNRYIVNRTKLSAQANSHLLIEGIKIPISRIYQKALKKLLNTKLA